MGRDAHTIASCESGLEIGSFVLVMQATTIATRLGVPFRVQYFFEGGADGLIGHESVWTSPSRGIVNRHTRVVKHEYRKMLLDPCTPTWSPASGSA